MSPGITYLPATFSWRAPAGIETRPRGPAATIFAPSTTTTASLTGAEPVPSMSVAPTRAVTGPAANTVDEAVMNARKTRDAVFIRDTPPRESDGTAGAVTSSLGPRCWHGATTESTR